MMRTDAPVLLLLVLGLAVCVDYAAAGCFQWPTYTRLDTRTTISIRRKLDGMQVYRFCPGVDYVVKVQFPEPRSLKLAAAQGIWEALTGNCANMTSKTVQNTTWELPLSMPCDIVGDLISLKIASKVAMAETFFGKNITFPLNPLSACPKSRCNLVSGMSNTTVASLLSGVPLFDLFTQMGVKLGLGANQLLTFDVTKLNKTMTPEAFMQVLMNISQFKTLGAKAMLDPTLVLSLLSKFAGVVSANTSDATSILFFKECTKLLNLWGPTFWGSAATGGLSASSYIDMASKLIAVGSGGVAYSYTGLATNAASFFQAKNAPDALLNVMSAFGSVLSDGDGFFSTPAAPSVSVTSFMGVVGATTSMVNSINGPSTLQLPWQ